MSIATLKRKTFAKYNNSSVQNNEGFSINGMYRNQGYVGQTSLSRSLNRTLMKGNTPRGHGGCCGTYDTSHIIKPSCFEDNKSIKKSVMSSSNRIKSKLNSPLYNEVKPISTPDVFSQWNYILKKKYCLTKNMCTSIPNVPSSCVQCVNKDGYVKKTIHQTHTKPEYMYLSLPYNDYIQRIKSNAMTDDITYVPVRTTRGDPYIRTT